MMRRFCRCRELHVRTVLVFMSDVACQSARISGETCVMPDVRYVMKYEVCNGMLLLCLGFTWTCGCHCSLVHCTYA